MWQEFLALQELPSEEAPACSHWHFCDNQPDADECARLVVRGEKRASSPSLWSFESRQEPLPQAGDLHVITNWAGEAQCVIRITGVEVVAFDEITEEHARAEGEGDGSLAWWRSVHWPYYRRELEGSGYSPAPNMPIVFERFECVYPAYAGTEPCSGSASKGRRPGNSSKPTPLRGAALERRS